MTQLQKVRAAADLTGCSARIPTIAGMQESAVLKLRNSSHTFYLFYMPVLNQHAKTIDLSKKFMAANNLEEGHYRVEEVRGVEDAKEVKALVSRQDWEVIGEKSGVLQQQFLGQAKLVWNGLVLPIQHSKAGVVRLKCVCEDKVMRLRENSRIHIEIEEEEAQKKPVEFKQLKLREGQGYDQLKAGHNETVYIHPSHFEGGQLLPHVVYELEDAELISSRNLQTFQKYLKSQKQSPEEQSKSKQRWYVKFAPAQRPDESPQLFHSNSLYSSLTNIPPYFACKGQYSPNDTKLQLANEYFVSAQCRIQVFLIPIRQGFKKPDEWLSFFTEMLAAQTETLFINGGVYHCRGEFFLVSISSTADKPKAGEAPTPGVLLIKKVKDYLSVPSLKTSFTQAVKQKLIICDPEAYESTLNESERGRINSILAVHRGRQASTIRFNETSQLFQSLFEDQLKRIQTAIDTNQHLLISSPNKNGKTFLCSYLQRRLRMQVFYLNFELLSADNSYRLKDVVDYLQLVIQSSPGILYFDNVDAMCKLVPKDLHRQAQMISSRVLSRKIVELVQLYSESTLILVAQNHENLDEALKDLEATNILLKNPATESRRRYFYSLYEHDKANELLSNTESMSFSQVLNVVTDTKLLAQLSQKKQLKKEQQQHNFSRIAGLQTAKQTILQTMEAPFKYSFLYKDLPIKMPKGVLLYGPSGVGKTYLANAVKEQVKITFFEFKGSDILNMYIGASEQAVRDIFETAMSVAPSVVFFDEFESIVPKRTANNTGVTDRIVNQFLCYLDGVSALEGVFIMAASSRPEMIDPALLRPGRIDKHVFLDYPTLEERTQLLTIYQHAVVFEQPLQEIAKKTEHYSYSDMVGLLKELRIKRAGILLKQESYEKSDFKLIPKDFFQEIRKSYRTSSTPQQQTFQRRRFELFAKGENDSLQHQRLALK